MDERPLDNTEDRVAAASAASFPASDPPAWTGSVGAPTHSEGVDPRLHPHLTPLERRVRSMLSEGWSIDDIARALDRSPRHVRRIIRLSALERPRQRRRFPAALRSRVVDLRTVGESYRDIGRRFSRRPRSIKQIEGFAHLLSARTARSFERGLRLLESAAEDARAAIARRNTPHQAAPDATTGE